MIHPQRVRFLNENEISKGRYVLYWMQTAQRADFNHALEYAVARANELDLPVAVVFGLFDRYPEANARHFYFMLEGLKETQDALERRGIFMGVIRKPPDRACLSLARDAALVVIDQGLLRMQRAWRVEVARKAPCCVAEVETEVIVPVQEASVKEEYSAGTFRPRIHRALEEYMIPLRKKKVKRKANETFFKRIDLHDLPGLLKKLRIDRSVGPSPSFRGGASQAVKRLNRFIKKRLPRFHELRNDPSKDYLSQMSPYLHFGQISPLYLALRIRDAAAEAPEAGAAYLEELIVRRELSMNFVFYNPQYDDYASLPAWALKTLDDHRHDPRDFVYSREEWEGEATHDPYWNAAQKEMRITGKMHGYMRMYWGKKILEWSKSPEEAFDTALYLNNKYELDGRDPNGFTGVAWCFGKHDRAWGERPVYGKVRSMVAAGLRRKFDIESYVQAVDSLA